MRGFKNTQGTFFHCTEIGERNWALRLVGSGDVGPTARNVSKNPSQRLDTGIIPTPWWFTPEVEQQLLAIGEDGKLPASFIKSEATSPDSAAAELSEEQLRARLMTQLEYYFSRENLNQDRYLRSQMDTDQYVPINVVASFPKVSRLTSDHDLILSVLKESTNLQVDETNTKVRAAHRRCTLLLREIPEFTDEREVKAMFVGCPPYTSLSYGLNNSWYVTFETEEATQLAFLHLQNLRKSFNGKQICVRIKTGSAPLPDHGGDHGRYSPAKSETFSGLGSGIATVTTSNGYITGFPATTTFILNPNSTRATSETELNLDQLMGPFGYSIRGIFQPKESEPPSMSDEDGTVPLNEARKTKSPKLSVAAANVGKSLLGPPSTEIVESLLSAAAEANETKRREKEVQRQQWQQIMDGLAPTPSMIGGPRVTDMPFIKRAPLLHRFTSQESSDIEVALDIQRAARKQEKEAKLQQQVQQQHQAQQQEQTQPQQEHRPPSSQQHQYHDGYRQTTTSKNYSDRSNKDYNHYNGYSSGERSGYDKSERRPNTPYRDPSKRGYDSRSDRSGKSGDYYKPKERNSERSSYNTTSNNYYYDRTSTYNNPPRYERPRYPPAERKSFTSRPTYAPSTPQIQTTSYAAEPTQAEVPEPERPRSILSSEPLITPPELIIVPSSALHSDTASTTSSRKKDNSESSEYNFVDGDFPSLVDKQNVKAKEKEKAKFSAVVAGKKNDVKKSYAQTLRKPDRASR